MKKPFSLCIALVGVLSFLSCKKAELGGGTVAGKFLIVGTLTDNGQADQAKANAENALILNPDLSAMVGLYGYNPPSCLEAVRDMQKRDAKTAGKVKIFGFDGLDATLEGIDAGMVEGTVVQQPFEFGYQSMKTLKALADGKSVESKDGIIDIPVKIITKETAAGYRSGVSAMLAAAKQAPPAAAGAPVFSFITNNQSSFWEEARAGCYKAQAELGVAVDFQMPSQQDPAEQNRILESILVKGESRGVAISVISPDSQGEFLNKVSDRMPLITHDSDAPKSARKAYLGTNNYEAGRALGKFMRERMPDGGKIMLFVGSVDAMNARERIRGLTEALSAP